MKYTNIKSSNIEWIGDIPSHWEIKRGKNCLTLLSRPVLDDDDIITCFRDGEVTLRKNRREEGFTNALLEIGYQGVKAGDLVVHGMDGFAGAIGISDSRGKASPVLNVMDSPNCKRFLMYYLRSLANKEVFLSLATGIRVRSCDLRWNKLAVLPFILPPLSEQNAIAAYLDEKCGTIDAIIEEAKASIEEYKAWKSSVIFEAVTKGLNPNAEMKDSGVEWIGKVPKHWDVVSLKRFYDYTHGAAVRVGPFGSALASGDIIADGIWVYNQRTVLDNNFMSNDTCVSEEKAKQLSSFRVYPGDILITTRGSIGKIAIVPSYAPPGLLHPCIIRFRVNENRLNKNLLRYIFNDTDMVKKQILYYSNSTTIDVLYSYTLKEIKIPLIPLDEQQQIIDFLDKKCAAIDGIIAEKEALIADMEAYKKSLIFETVTGKRKIC